MSEANTKFTSIERWGLLIMALALVVAIAIRLMITYYGGVFNIPYVLRIEAIIYVSSISIILLLCKNKVDKYLTRAIIIFLGIITVVAFIGVMFSDSTAAAVGEWFGTKGKKTETLQFLGWIISGFIGFFGLFAFNRRAAAQDEANEVTKIGLSLEKFKLAVEQLSNKKSALTRRAAFHSLFYLANTRRESYAQPALDILCEHLRQISNVRSEQELSKSQSLIESRTLIDMLFSPEAAKISDELYYDLRHVKLSDFDLQKMHKPKVKVDFSEADLSGAILNYTDLSGFIFQKAELRNAKLQNANLQNADLSSANLGDANLQNADLSNANLSNADLFIADLSNANLSNADLSEAELFIANLSSANLCDANLSGATLRGATLSNADLFKTNFSSADFCGANLHKAKRLKSAILSKAKYDNTTTFPDGFSIPECMEEVERKDSKILAADS